MGVQHILIAHRQMRRGRGHTPLSKPGNTGAGQGADYLYIAPRYSLRLGPGAEFLGLRRH
jgi:hypothetical protein